MFPNREVVWRTSDHRNDVAPRPAQCSVFRSSPGMVSSRSTVPEGRSTGDRSRPRQEHAGVKYTVEITSHVAGHIVRIEADASDERSAIDTAADRYERQLRKLKERLIQRNRTPNKDLNPPGDYSDVSSDRGGGIVRTKRFAMKPMTAEEAVLQMEMLGHDFFFFLDAESDRHCVVYHRRDGNVGLIQPE